MKVYTVEYGNIEGQNHTHDIYSSYDLALEIVKKIMVDSGEHWTPFKNLNNWWYYENDSLGITEYEVKDKLPEVQC